MYAFIYFDISVIEWRMSFTKMLFKRICKFVLLKKYLLGKSNDVFFPLKKRYSITDV